MTVVSCRTNYGTGGSILQCGNKPTARALSVFGRQIVAGYARALQTALDACDALAETIDIDNGPQLKKLVDAAVGTKFSFRWVLLRLCGL